MDRTPEGVANKKLFREDKTMSAQVQSVLDDTIRVRIDESAISLRQMLIVFICFAINFTDGFDVIAMSVAAPVVSEDLAVRQTELGVVFSAALFGMAIGSLFLAPLSDRWGRRKVILLSVFAISTSMLLTAFVGNLIQLVALRFLTGIGIGAVLASATSITSEFMPGRRRSLAIIIVATGFTVGTVVVGPLAGFLIERAGWHSVFVAGSALGYTTLLCAFFLLPESIEFMSSRKTSHEVRLDKVNNALAKIGLAPISQLPVAEQPGKGARTGIFKLVDSEYLRNTLLLWTLFFVVYFAVYFLLNWIPQLFTLNGFELEQSIFALTILTLGGLIGAWFLAVASTWININRLVSAMLFIAAALLAAFCLARPASPYLSYGAMFLVGFSLNGGLTALYAVVSRIYPVEIQATGIGWSIGVGRFGAILSPLIAGYVLDLGWAVFDAVLLLGVPAAIVGAIIVLQISRD